MTIRISSVKAIAALNAALSGADTLKIFSGSAPADVETAASGTQLATMTVGFDTATDTDGEATATLTASASDTSTVAGTAGYFRVLDGATALFQGTVGTSGEDLNLNSTTIPGSATLTITALTLELPEVGT